MTATLPDTGLHELGHVLLMPNIQYIWQSADRLELAYCVVHLERHERQDAAVKKVLRREKDELVTVTGEAARSWRAIVYCYSQRQCSDMAHELDAPHNDDSLCDEQQRCALDQ